MAEKNPKLIFHHKDYYEKLVWFYRLSAGVALLGAESPGGRRLTTVWKVLLVGYGLLCMTIHVHQYWLYVTGLRQLPFTVSPLCLGMLIFSGVIVALQVTIAYLFYNFSGSHFGRIVTALRQLTSQLANESSSSMVSRKLLLVCVSSIVIGTAATAYNTLTITRYMIKTNMLEQGWLLTGSMILVCLTGQYIMLISFTFALYFAAYCGAICQLISRSLNDLLFDIHRQSISYHGRLINHQDLSRMKHLYGVYTKLWDTFDAINAALQSQLMIAVPSAVINFSTLCLLIVDQITRPEPFWMSIISFACAVGAISLQLILLCIANDWLNNQKKAIHCVLKSDTVQNLLLTLQTGDANKQSELIKTWLTGWDRWATRRMTFTAYGFYRLDKSLILSVASLILTYCVILVQSNGKTLINNR